MELARVIGTIICDRKYVGLEGKVLGIDRFGISAPGNTVFKELGMTKDAVVAAANAPVRGSE